MGWLIFGDDYTHVLLSRRALVVVGMLTAALLMKNRMRLANAWRCSKARKFCRVVVLRRPGNKGFCREIGADLKMTWNFPADDRLSCEFEFSGTPAVVVKSDEVIIERLNDSFVNPRFGNSGSA